jgi:hypothetical protein
MKKECIHARHNSDRFIYGTMASSKAKRSAANSIKV